MGTRIDRFRRILTEVSEDGPEEEIPHLQRGFKDALNEATTVAGVDLVFDVALRTLQPLLACRAVAQLRDELQRLARRRRSELRRAEQLAY